MKKYYMNNPCEVIREISTEFSEVKVYPQFVDNLNGSDFCVGCLAGHMDGTPNQHVCGEYQEVIDAINDQESSMIVVVENRLLQDEPVEFKAWKKVREHMQEMQSKAKDKGNELLELGAKIATRSQLLVDVNEEIHNAKIKQSGYEDDLLSLSSQLDSMRDKVSEMQDSVSIGSVSVGISGDELRGLIKSHIILQALEAGGVDNWDWYGESLPDGDIDDLVQRRIESLTVKAI